MRDLSGYPGGVFDTNPTARGLVRSHVSALFCRYASNIRLQDIEVKWKGTMNPHWSHVL